MAKNYTISGNRSKGYHATADGGKHASFTGRTQKEVINKTREAMKSQGGGELRIQRTTNGTFHSADTIPPKQDKFPPRG